MSEFLLDTNVISELVKPKADRRVADWIDGNEEVSLYLSVLSLGEIRKGIALVANLSRRTALENWMDRDLISRFTDRILPIDRAVADQWSRITAQAIAAGVALPVIDGLLAATALQHEMTLVTRNTKDVAASGVRTVNPWGEW